VLGTQCYDNPFVGLRPFNWEESHLFFGREGQTDELLSRLQEPLRFLAVVGTSGSGKSSLVRAGLLPALYGGFMVGASSVWQVAVMRPGKSPIASLANALHHPDVFGLDPKYAGTQPLVTETTLRLSNLGLIEVVQRASLPPESNLLIVVDQFEELFRFIKQARMDFKEQVRMDAAVNEASWANAVTDEAAAFVRLLLEAAKNQEVPVYIVLTMRSDFLGECAQFRDLPEAINDSQYLIPRMTRDELRSAIVGPISVGGGKIRPSLVNQLLNDVEDDPDQLPVLQHALMLTWNYWREHYPDDEYIDLPHYQNIGGMKSALSNHADDVYKPLDERGKALAKVLFKQLTETAADNRGFRRPTELGDICAVAEASPEEVIRVVEQFRQSGRSFVMPPEPETLEPDTVLDISHESLMRIWKTLKQWAEEEAQDAAIYRRLAQTARLHEEGRAELLQGAELAVDLEWLEKAKPNSAWAKRYDRNYDLALEFLNLSRVARDADALAEEQRRQKELRQKEKENQILRRSRNLAIVGCLSSVVAVILGTIAFFNFRESERHKLEALTASSDVDFAANQQLEALMESLRAGERLKQPLSFLVDADTQFRVLSVLRQRVYEVRERNRLIGHTDWVSDVSFSPDGQTIVTGGGDGTIKLWNRNGSEIRTFEKQNQYISSIQFSPDGKTFASASWDGTIKLWSREGQLLREFKSGKSIKAHAASAKRVNFSPNGKKLASASDDKTIKLWDVQTGTELRSLIGHKGGVNSVRFSHNGKELISAGKDGTIRRWRSEDGIQLREFSVKRKDSSAPLEIEDAVLSPNGQHIVSASQDKNEPLKLWDLNGNEQEVPFGQQNTVYRVEFSPDGETFASANEDGTVKLWDLNGQELETFKGHQGIVWSISFSPDGQTIASAGEDKTVKLWSRDVGNLVQEFKSANDSQAHDGSVNWVGFSPDGQTIASASDDQTIKLWSRDGTWLKNLAHDQAVGNASFSPSGRTLASASADTIKLWGLDGEVHKTLKYKDLLNSLSFSPDEQTLASGSSDKTIQLWFLKTETSFPLNGSQGSVLSVNFSPDGKALISGGGDNKVRLWYQTEQKWRPQVLGSHGGTITSVRFSPNGQVIASGSEDKTVKLWNREGRLLKTLYANQYVYSVGFSADGRIVLSANENRTIKLWDVQTGKDLNTLKGHAGNVKDASFDSADRAIISAGEDGKLIFWNLDLDNLLKQGCSEIRDYLSTLPEKEQSICSASKK
jgi:WD40 repeat protein